MLEDAYAITDGPSAIRWPRTAAPVVADHEVGRGRAGRKVRSGTGVCLIGVGKMLAAATEAAALLEADGIDATVWDPRCVRPLDPDMIADAGTHDLVVTIEDGLAHGGIGTSVARALRDTKSRADVEVLGVPTEYIPHGDPTDILHALGLDGEGVAATVRRLQ